jgi:hypothetical protein
LFHLLVLGEYVLLERLLGNLLLLDLNIGLGFAGLLLLVDLGVNVELHNILSLLLLQLAQLFLWGFLDYLIRL